MEILNFNDYVLNEKQRYESSKYDGQIYFIRPTSNIDWLTGDSRDVASKMNEEAAFRLFKIVPTDEHASKDLKIDHSMPIIYYGGNVPSGVNFLKDKKVKRKNMYNKPEGMKITGDKVAFQKMFEKDGFMPKAVFTKAAAKTIAYPVVAKIADGHSGEGIVKFDDHKKLMKSKDKFDLYMEYIDFDTEYRVMFLKDEMIIVNERVPVEDENMTIDTMGYNDKVRFVYVDQDLKKVPQEFTDEITEIAKVIREKLGDIDLYSVDIVMDKKGKMWVLEVNTGTGIGSAKMALIYMLIYEQFYGKKLPDSYKKELTKRYIHTGNALNYPTFKKEISKSKWPIDYPKNTTAIPEEWK